MLFWGTGEGITKPSPFVHSTIKPKISILSVNLEKSGRAGFFFLGLLHFGC